MSGKQANPNNLPDKPAKRNKTIVIDWQLVDKQLKAGQSKSSIARSLGLTPVAFMNRMTRRNTTISCVPMITDPQALVEFKEKRADILAEKHKMVLDALDSDKIKKSSAYQLAGMSSILQQQERLERNLATDNVSLVQKILDTVREAPIPGIQTVDKS